MHISDRDDFTKLLMGMAGMYSFDLSEAVLKLYWKILQTYPWPDVAKALRLHAEDPDTGQFMPKPADIIRIIKGNSQSQCLQAWTKVERAIRTIGPYYSVVFDDALIHAVIDEMGGWVKLCKVTEKELNFITREFQTRYTSYKYKTPDHYPSKLLGLTDHYNLRQGYPTGDVVFIGDKDKANKIFSQGNEVNQVPTQRLNQIVKQTMEALHA